MITPKFVALDTNFKPVGKLIYTVSACVKDATSLKEKGFKIVAVIGYPWGISPVNAKLVEAQFAIRNGADIVAFIPNLVNFEHRDIVRIREEIEELSSINTQIQFLIPIKYKDLASSIANVIFFTEEAPILFTHSEDAACYIDLSSKTFKLEKLPANRRSFALKEASKGSIVIFAGKLSKYAANLTGGFSVVVNNNFLTYSAKMVGNLGKHLAQLKIPVLKITGTASKPTVLLITKSGIDFIEIEGEEASFIESLVADYSLLHLGPFKTFSSVILHRDGNFTSYGARGGAAFAFAKKNLLAIAVERAQLPELDIPILSEFLEVGLPLYSDLAIVEKLNDTGAISRPISSGMYQLFEEREKFGCFGCSIKCLGRLHFEGTLPVPTLEDLLFFSFSDEAKTLAEIQYWLENSLSPIEAASRISSQEAVKLSPQILNHLFNMIPSTSFKSFSVVSTSNELHTAANLSLSPVPTFDYLPLYSFTSGILQLHNYDLSKKGPVTELSRYLLIFSAMSENLGLCPKAVFNFFLTEHASQLAAFVEDIQGEFEAAIESLSVELTLPSQFKTLIPRYPFTRNDIRNFLISFGIDKEEE